jgi:hypothetical protein
MSRKRRKPSASAVINASMAQAAEQAEQFLQFLDYINEQNELNKDKVTTSADPAPARVVVAK